MSLSLHDVRLVRGQSTAVAHTLRVPHASIAAGEILAIVGQSGIGKSTLAAAIAGAFERADAMEKSVLRRTLSFVTGTRHLGSMSGAILFKGTHVQELPAESVAVQPQEALLVEDLTSIANLRIAGVDVDDAIGSAARSLQLDLESRKRVRELSGGMRRRLSILRALGLAREGQLLILDEPFEGVGSTLRAALCYVIRGWVDRCGLACCIVSHHISATLAIADAVLWLHDFADPRADFARNAPDSVNAASREMREFLLDGDAIVVDETRAAHGGWEVLASAHLVLCTNCSCHRRAIDTAQIQSVNHWSRTAEVLLTNGVSRLEDAAADVGTAGRSSARIYAPVSIRVCSNASVNRGQQVAVYTSEMGTDE